MSVNIQHVTDAPFKKAEASPAETLTRIPHLPRLPEVNTAPSARCRSARAK